MENSNPTTSTPKKDLFFPYYVNQGRLLDIYAILNNGYSEYEELSEDKIIQTKKDSKAEATVSTGFKIFKIAGDFSAGNEKSNSFSGSTTVKKIQTVTSILSIVLSELKSKNYLVNINDAKVGSFIAIPVNLKINSIKNTFEELSEVMKLISEVNKLGADTGIKNSEIKNYDNIVKSLKSFVNSEEIIYECDDFAITGNISEHHYYQGSKCDIINTDIMCLAQIKKIFPDGTELMKNNKLDLIKDVTIKNSLIKCVEDINKDNVFNFSSTAVSEIKNKPVYQIEIVALYQLEKY